MTVLPSTAAVLDVVHRTLGRPSSITVLVDLPEERRILECRAGDRRVVVRCIPASMATSQFRHLDALSTASARCTTLQVPKPIALELTGDAGVLVLEHLAGSAYRRIVAPTGATPSAVHAMRLAGRALAELHGIDPADVDGLPVTSMRDHIAQLVRPHPSEFASLFPCYAPLVDEAMSRIESMPAASVRRAVLHRDVHLRQMFRVDGRVGLIDWDLMAVGDPAFDVGYLVTHLVTHVERPDDLVDAVLTGYGDPLMTPDRLEPYRWFNLIRRACRRARLGDADWLAEIDRMMAMLRDELERVDARA